MIIGSTKRKSRTNQFIIVGSDTVSPLNVAGKNIIIYDKATASLYFIADNGEEKRIVGTRLYDVVDGEVSTGTIDGETEESAEEEVVEEEEEEIIEE